MKKKILGLVMIVMLTTGLTSCGNKNLTSENAQALVEEFLQDFKNGKYEEMYALTHDAHPYFQGLYDANVQSKAVLFEELSNELEYEILNIQVDGKEATVNTHVSNIDTTAALNDVSQTYYDKIMELGEDKIKEADTEALLVETIKQCFEKEDAAKKEADTVFNLIEKDGEWTIESNILIYDDITGGYTIQYTWNNLSAADDTK